jgi:hypothetical protein
VARTAPPPRRSANGWGARAAASLSSLVFAFALTIGAIQDYSYEVTPTFCDGVDDDPAIPFLCALPNDGIKDFSNQKASIPNVRYLIGPKSVERLSAVARSPQLMRRSHYPVLKRLFSAERRPSQGSVTDPD